MSTVVSGVRPRARAGAVLGRFSRLLTAVVVALAFSVTVAAPASASVSNTPDPTAPGVTGTVWSILQVGDVTYLGGEFTAVGGVARRNAAAIRADGSVTDWNPSPDGIVYALAASTDGSRIFLGGTFLTAAGVARARLAAVDPVTAVDLGWSADVNDTVFGLAVHGSRLYVAGRYTAIGATTQKRLVAVDTTTAAVNTAFKPRPNWTVKAVAVSPDGTKVYAVGGFDIIGGVSRGGAAELNASDGNATAFAPTGTGYTLTLALSPDGSRFFYSTSNNILYAYDPAVSNSPVWTVKTSGDVQAIASSSSEVYVGGHFSQFNEYKLKRGRLASVRYADGVPTDWNPKITESYMGVWVMTTTANAVLVGGDFTKINNRSVPGFARFLGTP